MFSIHTLTLRAAGRLCGGAPKLARYLGVPAHSVVDWLQGSGRPPPRVFKDCVDLLLFHEQHLCRGARADRSAPRAPDLPPSYAQGARSRRRYPHTPT